MDEAQKKRFQELQGKRCSIELISQIYGLEFPDESLLGKFRAWAQQLRRIRDVELPGSIDRHALETFFQTSKLIPEKWAAAKLGMADTSLHETLEELKNTGRIPQVLNDTEQVIDENLIRGFYKYFASLRNVIFADHNDFCTKLHTAIREELNYTVTALHCVTSEALRESPADYAYAFDAITLEPVGIKYQVWLDFHKPMNLRPDCCSVKFYAAEKETLRPFLFAGREPDLPPSLLI